MKKVKLLTLVVLVLTCLVSAFAAAALDKTLYVAVGKHPWFDAIKSIIPQFEKKYGCKLVLDEVDCLRLYDKLKMSLSPTRSDYDIIMMDVVWLPEFADNGYLMSFSLKDLDKDFDYDDIFPAYRKGLCEWKGKMVALPLGGHSSMLAYRKDWFERDGIKPPTNMDELLAVAKRYTADTNHDGKRDVYGITFRAKKGHEICFTYLEYMWAFGGRMLTTNNRPVINSKQNVAALKYLIELAKSAAPEDIASYTFNEMLASFQQGKSAMWTDSNSVPSFVEDPKTSIVAGKVGYAQFPRYKNRPPITCLAGWDLAVPAAAQQKELALKFIEFQASKANDKTIVANGREPYRKSTLLDPELTKRYPWFPVLFENLQAANPEFRPRLPEWQQMGEILGLSLSEALAGEKTPQRALDECQAQLEKLLKHYYEK